LDQLNKQTNKKLARRVVLVGGLPLAGPQEELRGPSGYTPWGLTSSPEREAKKGFSGFVTTKKKKKWSACGVAA